MGMTERLWMLLVLLLAEHGTAQDRAASVPTVKIENGDITVEASPTNGTYTIRSKAVAPDGFTARLGARVDHRWVYSDGYPQHTAAVSWFT